MAAKLVPDYEVKILLEPSEVLEPNMELNDQIYAALSLSPGSKKSKKTAIQFLDTAKQDMYTNGWSLRIRKAEGKDKLDLAYKRRYPISQENPCAVGDDIDAALCTAAQDGFDSKAVYEAQVEVGYRKLTLSITHVEEVANTGFKGTDLPLAQDSRHILASKAPAKFKDWTVQGWGTDHLANSIVYGPILARRLKGKWHEAKVVVEVWPIRKSRTDASLVPIVEVSFKTPDLNKALAGREKLVEFLHSRGWLLAEDSLKTKLVMERYGEAAARCL